MYFALLSAVATAAPAFASRIATRALFTPRGRRSSQRGDAFLATGRREDHQIDDHRVATWHWSGGARGSTVLCLHGWGGSAAQFAAIVPALIAQGFDAIAIDAPGHGKSSGRDSSIPMMRDVLAHLGRLQSTPVSMVAHSGGAVAATLALAAGLRAERLAFIGPTIDPSALIEQLARASGVSNRLLDGVRRRTEARFGIAWTGLRVAPLAAARREPLLVVHDREDAEVPWQEGAALAEAWPGAQLISTEGLGHRRVLYDPVVAETIAHFLSGARGREAWSGALRQG